MAVKKKSKPRTKKKKETAKKTAAEDFFAAIEPTPEYIKHLVECRCSLAQFRSWKDPPNHKFVVFSELEGMNGVKPSHAQCNNCGIIHRVTEIGVSITLKKEELRSLTTKDDLEGQMPVWLTQLLKKNECDLHIWQEAKFIMDNQMWGRFIVLAKEREDDMVMGKICQILGDNLHRIENFERDESAV